MSIKQTRKSISISGELYRVLRKEAEARCVSGSGMVESVLRRYLGLPPAVHHLNKKRRVTAKPEALAARKLGRPVTKLKISGPPVEGTDVEVIKTSVHVAVDPAKQKKLDDDRRASNIFTF